jgi:hypothetical protein
MTNSKFQAIDYADDEVLFTLNNLEELANYLDFSSATIINALKANDRMDIITGEGKDKQVSDIGVVLQVLEGKTKRVKRAKLKEAADDFEPEPSSQIMVAEIVDDSLSEFYESSLQPELDHLGGLCSSVLEAVSISVDYSKTIGAGLAQSSGTLNEALATLTQLTIKIDELAEQSRKNHLQAIAQKAQAETIEDEIVKQATRKSTLDQIHRATEEARKKREMG